jgi:hypothetical protein
LKTRTAVSTPPITVTEAATGEVQVRSLTVSLTRGLAVALVVLGILLRFIYLDADPYYYDWTGYITDEGRWSAHARALALFGRTSDVGWSLHLTLAPLYQLANYVIFSLSTVSLTTSRLLSAMAGSALLVSFWLLMRRVASPPALLVGLTLLALEMDLLVLSRLAVPEMVVMALQLLVYALIVATRGSYGQLALAGCLQAIAVGMKATALPTLAIFLLVVLARPSAPGERRRVWSLAAFGAGFAAPLALAALAWSACCYPRGIDLQTLQILRIFVRPSNAYHAIGFFFDDSLAPILNTWAVAVWLGIVGWMSSDDADPLLRAYLRTATIWWVGYSVVMLGLLYFPNRYKAHVFVPMAISIAAGLTLFKRVGLAGVDDALARGRGLAGVLRVAVVALPTAVFLAPLLAAGVEWVSASPPRLRLKVLCVAASFAATAWILGWRRRRRRSNVFFVTFPVIAVIAWWTLRWVPFDASPFWPSIAFPARAGWWAGFLLATALLTALTNRGVRRAGALGATRLVAAGAIVTIVMSIANVAPGYVDPHYSIRDASRSLGERLAGYGGVVATLNAEGLFNDNTLRYTTILSEPAWRAVRPDVFVTIFDSSESDGILQREYCLVDRYRLYVSPEFFRSHPELGLEPGAGVSARVYRREAGGCPRGAVVSPVVSGSRRGSRG